MILSKKIRLFPTEEQEKDFIRFSGASRWCWNECLAYRDNRYSESKQKTTIQECIEHLQDLKYGSEEYKWLQDIPEAITKQVVKDLDKSFKEFFKGIKRYPKFKKKGKCKVSFYQRTDKFRQVDDTHVKITGVKAPVRIHKCIIPLKVLNTRISYDNKFWYLSYSYEVPEKECTHSDIVLGVDLGIKNFAVISDGRVYKNINKTFRMRKLQKRRKRLQRKLSRKYLCSHYQKTSNIKKLENVLRLLDRRIANIRKTYIHTVTRDLVRNTPRKIVIEDLNIRGMMKNRHLSKSIQEQAFYTFREYLTYKCKLYNIELLIADRFFPSSKRCSRCGSIKDVLKLSERVYTCEHCHLVIDRDLNASINLASL